MPEAGARRRAAYPWYIVGLSLGALALWEWCRAAGVGDLRPAVPWLMALLGGLSVVAQQFPVRMGRDRKASVASSPLLAAALLFSAADAMALAGAASLIGNALLRLPLPGRAMQRRPVRNWLFNAAQTAMSVGLASVTYHLLAGNQAVFDPEPPRHALAALLAALVAYLVNTVAVAVAVGLFRGQGNPFVIWRRGRAADWREETGLALLALVTATIALVHPWIMLVQISSLAVIHVAFREAEERARLHEALRLAAGRTTATNEQWLRRISADLHDGPGQMLAFALLRIDTVRGPGPESVEELEAIEGAVRGALTEIRAISQGLRLPELEPLPVAEVIERAVRGHERRSGTKVAVETRDLPEPCPVAVKIALFRSLQESLSNATRHGGGIGMLVRVWAAGSHLTMAVSDQGPGLPACLQRREEQLGLEGMRERAQLLGGRFAIDSTPGQGTTVYASWSLLEPSEAAGAGTGEVRWQPQRAALPERRLGVTPGSMPGAMPGAKAPG